MQVSILKRLSGIDASVYTEHLKTTPKDSHDFLPVITLNMQSKVLEAFRNLIPYEQFFMVVDARTYKVIKAEGFEKWLGYNDRQLTMEGYLRMMSEEQLLSRNLYSYVLLKKMHQGLWSLDFMNQHADNLFSVRDRNGNWVTLKRSAYVFQHDEKHRLLEYFNHFTIVAHEKLQPMGMRIMDNEGKRLLKYEGEIKTGVKAIVEESGIFSAQQVVIVNAILEEDQNDCGIKRISELTGLNPEAVKTQVLRIRNKVNELLNSKFLNSVEAVLYLRQQGLI